MRNKISEAERFLFYFDRTYLYAFIAGILISLSINIFTTAILTESLPISIFRVYAMALAPFISSFGAFRLSAILEAARSDWEAAGSPQDPIVIETDYLYVGNLLKRMRFYFTISLISFIFFLLLVLPL